MKSVLVEVARSTSNVTEVKNRQIVFIKKGVAILIATPFLLRINSFDLFFLDFFLVLLFLGNK